MLRIKEFLELRGISQGELARRIGMAEQDMSEVINGKRNPTLKTLQRIAEGLGVPVRDLFPGEETRVCRLLEREIGEAALWELLEWVRKIKKDPG